MPNLTELANAILALNQCYSYTSQSNCMLTKLGSAATESLPIDRLRFTVTVAPRPPFRSLPSFVLRET